jgi:hypothetical protein
MNTPKKPTAPDLEASEELETTYANLARIAHSPADFVIDFAHLLPSHKKTLIRARVVMSPLSAKMLVRALNENIARYEAAFGEIKVPQQSLADQLFRPPQPPEPPSENE